MKHVWMRVRGFSHVLLAAFGLSIITACGSGGSDTPPDDGEQPTKTYSIGGTISGNSGNVTLSLNGTAEVFSGNSFTFTKKVDEGQIYSVAFVSESTGQNCTLSNGSGTASANVSNIVVTCAPLEIPQFTIGGTISGNTGEVTLSLNGAQENFSGDSFTFTNKIEEGQNYTVAFVSESTGQNCTLSNGSGTASTNVSNIAVTCSPLEIPQFTIGGTISGNAGDVTLSLNEVQESFSGNSFNFTQTIEEGQTYSVAFVSESTGQNCSVSNGSGTASANVNDIAVTCTVLKQPLILNYSNIDILGTLNAGDFNGDGRPDLFFTGSAFGDHPLSGKDILHFLYAQNDGTFAGEQDLERELRPSSPKSYLSTVADFNGDGIDDFYASGISTLNYAYLGNATTPPTLSYTLNTVSSVTHPMYSAPLNGDSLPDILALYTQRRTISTLGYFHLQASNGDGTFETQSFAQEDELALDSVLDFHLADINGDNAVDILAIGFKKMPAGIPPSDELFLQVFTGNNDATFNLLTSPIALNNALISGDITNPLYQQVKDLSKKIASGDFNGDGKVDIAITSESSFVQIMLGDGLGGFSDGAQVLVGEKPVNLQARDFNNDGHLDLISANLDSNTVHISLGLGNGTFGDVNSNPDQFLSLQMPETTRLADMVIADFDLDNVLDVGIALLRKDIVQTHKGFIHVYFDPLSFSQ